MHPRAPIRFALLGAIALVGLSSGCRRAPLFAAAAVPTRLVASGSGTVVPGSARRAVSVKAHETISIVRGIVHAGSMPGEDGRDPTMEPAITSYDIPAFSIDALPYPNDPTLPAKTGVSRAEAARLCAKDGARLCSELEWERACRGPNGDMFGAGANWDPTCTADPSKCTSGFGVRAMGATLEEWTASDVELPKLRTLRDISPKKSGGTRAVARGSVGTSSASAHRCATRHGIDGHAQSGSIGFRCCRGGVDGPVIPRIEPVAAFRTLKLEGAGAPRLLDILVGEPRDGQPTELTRIRQNPRCFTESDLALVLKDKTPREGVTVTTDAVLWSPELGVEMLVVAGKSRGGAFVVAAHKLGDNKWKVASSLVFTNEQGPIALGFQSDLRREVIWSTQWGSAGEMGAVTYRDDRRVVIVQR